ncbi:MAG: hypothetical protein OHK0046_05270 [Anaerolineae bacterium]
MDCLQLPYSSLRKSIINVAPISSKNKGRKLIYGVCSIQVHSTHEVMHILGAIQEYAGIDKPEWLM